MFQRVPQYVFGGSLQHVSGGPAAYFEASQQLVYGGLRSVFHEFPLHVITGPRSEF